MPKIPPKRPLPRVPARAVQPSVQAKPKPGAITPLPDQTHAILERAQEPAGHPDAIAADQRFAKLTAPELLRELSVQRGHVAKGFYAMGLLLRELARQERFQGELGYATFDNLLEQKYVMNRMTALKYIAVVTTFEEKLATELGIEMSYALFRYASVIGKPADAPQLVVQNPEIGDEHLLDMSARDILRAAQDLKASKAAQAPSDLEHAARRAARLLQAWIRKSGAKKADARARRHQGKWGVSVSLTTDEALAAAGVV